MKVKYIFIICVKFSRSNICLKRMHVCLLKCKHFLSMLPFSYFLWFIFYSILAQLHWKWQFHQCQLFYYWSHANRTEIPFIHKMTWMLVCRRAKNELFHWQLTVIIIHKPHNVLHLLTNNKSMPSLEFNESKELNRLQLRIFFSLINRMFANYFTQLTAIQTTSNF